MLDFARRAQSGIYTNCKVEHFPGFSRFVVADIPIFREPGWEAENPPSKISKPQSSDSIPEGRSISRAKRKIFDIAALNPFRYFVTLTLDKTKIDRQSPEAVAQKLKTYLSNRVKRNDLRYIIVPEYHKDGRGIHLHGLFAGRLRLTDSGHRTRLGKPIYHLADWPYGFSTCVELTGDKEAVARYIAKYVTKDSKKILGHFYYAGGRIQREPEREYVNLLYDDLDAPAYYVADLGISFKYITVKGAAV